MIPDNVSEMFLDRAVGHPIKDQALHQKIGFDGSGFYEPHFHVINDNADSQSKTAVGTHIDTYHQLIGMSCEHPSHKAYMDALYRKSDLSHARAVVDRHMAEGCKAKA